MYCQSHKDKFDACLKNVTISVFFFKLHKSEIAELETVSQGVSVLVIDHISPVCTFFTNNDRVILIKVCHTSQSL